MFSQKITYIIIVFFLITVDMKAQTIHFDRTYPSLGDSLLGYVVKQMEDGGYLIGGYQKTKLVIVKTDEYGELIWTNEIGTNSSIFLSPKRTYPIETTSDGGFIVSTTTKIDTKERIYVIKFNSAGDTVWSRTYPFNVPVIGCAVLEADDEGYFVLGAQLYPIKNPELLKIDLNGNIIWTTSYYASSLGWRGFGLSKLKAGVTVIRGKNKIITTDGEGNHLWTKNISNYFTSLNSVDDSTIIVGKYGGRNIKLEKIDQDGNTLWEKDIPERAYHIEPTNDYGFIIISPGSLSPYSTALDNYIIKTNSVGDVTWQKKVRSPGRYISVANDGGFIVTGVHQQLLWLMKTDSEGYFRSMSLLDPNGGENIPLLSLYYIQWFTSNVEEVDIEYTADGGWTWTEIISSYPADSCVLPGTKYDGSYLWHVPNIVSDGCLIRVSESNNPSYHDISDSLFSIYYQPYHEYDFIAINEVKMWIGNNGDGSHNPNTDGGGYYWPGGIYGVNTAVFEDGLVYGGKINGEIRVNGNTHRQGLRPGNILPDGTAADPTDSTFKVWKIRKDWELLPFGPLRDEYEYDYNNWPGHLGAPYIDLDGDEQYTKGIDEPKFVGDEVLFYVANDLNPDISIFTYGSPPMGLEFQTTVWAYDREDKLKDAVFKKYKIINRSNETIEDMYLSYWCDDDVGYANDDYVGCDTTLNLGYSYNGDNYDDRHYGTPPPAVGHLMVQGPIIPGNPTDSAMYNNNWIKGHKNLPLTSFCLFIGPNAVYRDPTGILEFYNYMQGLVWDGSPFVDPNTGQETVFCLSGDPVKGSGWYEGVGWPNGPSPSDRYSLISSGPFTLAPGDTQEVVYAIFMARGTDHIQSIAELRNTAQVIYDFFGIPVPTALDEDEFVYIPQKYELYQNYPNPFNPTTTIEYRIPLQTHVELRVYDVLGREVTILVNEEQNTGNYKIEFDAGGLASGIYFYRLKTIDFIQSRKMILLK